MGYYIDQLAEQDRQRRLADLLALQELGGDERNLGNYPAPEITPVSMGTYQNETNRLGNYPAPVIPEYRGESMAGMYPSPQSPPRQFLSALAKPQFAVDPSDGLQRMTDRPGEVMQADMGTIRNNRTGIVTKVGGSGRSQPAGVAADWARPVNVMGADGHWAKDGSGRIVMKDGRIVEPGRDTGAERARMKEDLGLQKQRAELAQLQAKALNPEGIRLKQGERFKRDGSGEVEAIPGSDLDKKQKAKLSDAASQVDTHNKGVDALIKNINVLIGDDSEGSQQHPGLRGSVGYIDANIMPFTQDQATAKSFIKSLKDKSAVSGLQSIRQAGTAPGSITEKEWPIFQNLVNNLDAAQDIDSYKAQLRELRSEAIASKGRAAYNYQQGTGREYQAPPKSGGASGDFGQDQPQPQVQTVQPQEKRKLTTGDGEAMAWAMKNPNDPRAAKIKAKLGVQ